MSASCIDIWAVLKKVGSSELYNKNSKMYYKSTIPFQLVDFYQNILHLVVSVHDSTQKSLSCTKITIFNILFKLQVLFAYKMDIFQNNYQ